MTTTDLFEKYRTERSSALSETQFASLLMMYPSVLVACSDGNFDALEKQNLAISCRAAANDDALFAAELYSELLYLAGPGRTGWNDKIFTVLKNHLSSDSDAKEIIYNLMVEMAESSDGVSEDEKKSISSIKSELGL